MRQDEFVLKIIVVNEMSETERERLNYKGQNIIIEVWDVQANFLIEEKITEFYPQLTKVGIEEFDEGELSYSGFMGADALQEMLSKWGFIIYGSTKHLSLKHGGEIDCKIKPIYDLEKEEVKDLIKELQDKLEQAVIEEDYESAAKIRDEIKSKENEV